MYRPVQPTSSFHVCRAFRVSTRKNTHRSCIMGSPVPLFCCLGTVVPALCVLACLGVLLFFLFLVPPFVVGDLFLVQGAQLLCPRLVGSIVQSSLGGFGLGS